MKHISERIAKIAIEKGFISKIPYELHTHLTYQTLIEWLFDYKDQEFPFIGNDAKVKLQLDAKWLEFWYNILMPELCPTCGGCESECSVIDVHEPDCYRCNFRNNTDEFVLEGFIGMLINWFEKNNFILYINYGYNDYPHWSSNICNMTISDVDDKSVFISGIDYGKLLYETKSESRHEGILQIFKLLKTR